MKRFDRVDTKRQHILTSRSVESPAPELPQSGWTIEQLAGLMRSNHHRKVSCKVIGGVYGITGVRAQQVINKHMSHMRIND